MNRILLPHVLPHVLQLMCWVLPGLVAGLATAADPFGKPSAETQAAWMLRIQGGDIYRGLPDATDHAERVRWSCPSFLGPLEFPWAFVDKIERVIPARTSSNDELNAPWNIFAVEQRSGITLSGDIASIDAQNITVTIPEFGTETIPLTNVKNVLRVFSATREPVQVLQPDAWEQVLPAPKNGKATKWFLKAGEISTDTSGTTISQWAKLPSLATIDLDVAWEQPTVNWWLTIGEPRRMELQVRKLQNKNLLNVTLLVENSRDADVASIQIPYPRDPSLSLRLLCDADKGAYVLMMDDQVLGRIKGNPNERIVGRTKFSFTNTALGGLTLRDLRIADRPFSVPSVTLDVDPTLAEVMTRTRGTFLGRVEPGASPSEIQVRGANDVLTTISLSEIERMEFPEDTTTPSPGLRPNLVRVDLANGLRFAAESVSSRAGAMDVCLKYGDRSLCIPWERIDRVTRIQSADSQQTEKKVEPSIEPRLSMQLLTENVVSTGNVDSVYRSEVGHRTLAWLPVHGSIPSPIHPQTSGAIEPLSTLPEVAAKKRSASVPMAVIRADMPRPEPVLSRELHPDDPSLFLISGDCFPGKVMAGDEENVVFQSPLFEKTDVPSVQVRGMRVVDFQGAEAIDRATRTRLLTLPRVQRKNPPTHLVVARDGDLLRGRLISFNRDELKIEVRGEERMLTMKNVAEIIWLEPAPPTPSPTSEEASTPEGIPSADTATTNSSNEESNTGMDGLYQIILHQGARVSIFPESVTRETLSGEHPVLGRCTLNWDKVHRLVLGNSIRLDASRNRFGKWKLQNAPDPKFVNEGSEQNDAPNDTALDRLIGQQAAEQDLLKLDGTPFRIADYRGKILILDFWASWCGPCLQGMPRIHQISREYQDAGVEVVFVNLEETEDRIRMLLERLEITPTVALDVDGSFSKQYAVQAIPQTVVIDRDGTIIKIFIGSGDETEANLIRLLNDLTKS